MQHAILLYAIASPSTVNPVIRQQMFQISQFIIEYVEDMVHMVDLVAFLVAKIQIKDKNCFTNQNTLEIGKHGLQKVVLTTRQEPIIFSFSRNRDK